MKSTTIFIKIYLLSNIFMLGIAFLGFSWIFVVYKKDTFFVDQVIPHFKKLSPIRKLIFGSFTVFSAIPNKFWINFKIHFIFVFIISIIIYCLGIIFPFLFICYIVYLMLCLENFVFGLLYEYSTYFKKFTNFMLFGSSSEPFALDYFQWFWGKNMWQQAGKKAASAVAGAAAANAKREQENREKFEYADKQTEQRSNEEEGFNNVTERAEFHKERRYEWIEENGTVTKIIKNIEDWCNAF